MNTKSTFTGLFRPAADAIKAQSGQHADYIEQALKAYRAGQRKNPIMGGMAAPLKDEDIKAARAVLLEAAARLVLDGPDAQVWQVPGDLSRPPVWNRMTRRPGRTRPSCFRRCETAG